MAGKRATRTCDNSGFAVGGVRWTRRSNLSRRYAKIFELNGGAAANRNSSLKLWGQ
jgi:hypothetical protein